MMMDAKQRRQLERLQQRLESWRRTRKPRSRIPERLWIAAAELAKSCGLNKVARALHLDYYDLKERRDGIADSGATAGQSPAPFVELISEREGWAAECVIELENCDGAKMRLQFKGKSVPEAAAICAEFLKKER